MLARASEYGVYTENLDVLKKVVRSARMDRTLLMLRCSMPITGA